MIHKSTADVDVAEIATIQCPNKIQLLPATQFSFCTKLNTAVRQRRMILCKDCKYILKVKNEMSACLQTTEQACDDISTEAVFRGSERILQSTGRDVQLLRKLTSPKQYIALL